MFNNKFKFDSITKVIENIITEEEKEKKEKHEDEIEDKALVKKMVKGSCLNKESWDDDEDDDVARADRELARMKVKPIKADKKTDPDKEFSKLAKKTPKEVDEELKGAQHKLDVAEPKGKLTGADFKKLRKEDAEQIDEISSGLASRYLSKTKPEYSSPKEIEKRSAGRKLALLKKWGDKSHGIDEPKVKATEELDLSEKTLTPAESKKKEEIVKSMKKGASGFKERYGKRAKEVMYATATKQAKKVAEEAEELDELSIPTMGSYVQKSIQQTMSGKKDRTPGMQTAYKKMTTKSPIQTEKPTDKLTNNESSNIGWMLKANPELNKKIELAKKKRAERKQLPVPSDSYMKSKDDKK